MSDIETEIKYAVIDDNPEGICGRLFAMTEIGDFALKYPEQVDIEDVYYDTPGGQLKKRGWALRTRRLDDRALVTLKGKTVLSQGGLISRTEIERPWSRNGLLDIVEAVQEIGVPLSEVMWDDSASPIFFLEAMGFTAIQIRRTLRKIRQVYARTGDHAAELAIDKVEFIFKDFVALHYEVEIEAPAEDTDKITRLGSYLAERFKPSLKVWVFNKLEMGHGIGRLEGRSDKDKYIAPNGRLLPDAYPELEKILRGS
jgi:inorganic triphosphatase YgiF